MSVAQYGPMNFSDSMAMARKKHEEMLQEAIDTQGVFGPIITHQTGVSTIKWQPDFSNDEGVCIFTICAHGSIAVSEGPEPRNKVKKEMNEAFRNSVFSREHNNPPRHPVNLTVAKVVSPNILVPGLSSSGGQKNPSNFSLHLPNITNRIKEFMTLTPPSGSIDQNLNSLATEILALMKEIDQASGIQYTKEESSNVGGLTTTEEDFYKVYKISQSNFIDAVRRLLYIRPNQGEFVNEITGRPKRETGVNRLPFSYYGVFIFTSNGGFLPESCTLLNNHDGLRKNDYKIGRRLASGHVIEGLFQTYDRKKVEPYNLAHDENRLHIEIRIGIHMKYLNPDGSLPPGDDAVEKWQKFKHDRNGPIQTLRRVITSEIISHVDASLILNSLGYAHLLLVDTACNCPDNIPPESLEIFDSQSGVLDVPPISHNDLLYNDDLTYQEIVREENIQKAIQHKQEEYQHFLSRAQQHRDSIQQSSSHSRSRSPGPRSRSRSPDRHSPSKKSQVNRPRRKSIGGRRKTTRYMRKNKTRRNRRRYTTQRK